MAHKICMSTGQYDRYFFMRLTVLIYFKMLYIKDNLVELWKEERFDTEAVELQQFVNQKKSEFVQKVVDDFHAKGRWNAIESHFQSGEFLGEDDVTNFIRLASSIHPNVDKFSWLNACAAGFDTVNLNYTQWLENFSVTSEILFIPHLKGAHFCLWIYYIKENSLVFIDPFNNKPSSDRRERIILIIFSLFDVTEAPGISHLILKAMKQRDLFNCGVICCDLVLCYLKNYNPTSIYNYNADYSRKMIFKMFKQIKDDNVIPAFMLLSGLPDITLSEPKACDLTTSFGSSVLIIDETIQKSGIQNLSASSLNVSIHKSPNYSNNLKESLIGKDFSSTSKPSTAQSSLDFTSLLHNNTTVLERKLTTEQLKAEIQRYELSIRDLKIKNREDEQKLKEKLKKYNKMMKGKK